VSVRPNDDIFKLGPDEDKELLMLMSDISAIQREIKSDEDPLFAHTLHFPKYQAL